MVINSKDYHDYVIKDGKLVGEFEQMYQNVKDPWPESQVDMDNNEASVAAKNYFKDSGIESALRLVVVLENI